MELRERRIRFQKAGYTKGNESQANNEIGNWIRHKSSSRPKQPGNHRSDIPSPPCPNMARLPTDPLLDRDPVRQTCSVSALAFDIAPSPSRYDATLGASSVLFVRKRGGEADAKRSLRSPNLGIEWKAPSSSAEHDLPVLECEITAQYEARVHRM